MNMVYTPFLICLLEIFTFARRVSDKPRTQALLTLPLLLGASKFLVFEHLGGSAFAPELNDYVIWGFDFFFCAFLLLLPMSLLALIFRFRGKRMFAVGVFAAFLAALGIYNSLKTPEVRHIELEFADLPSALEGYRIVQLTDLHASKAMREWRTEAIVEKANKLKANLICVTGDLADGEARAAAKELAPINKLTAEDGVYFVTGNHEYYSFRPAWDFSYVKWGLNVLRNRSVKLKHGLVLGGVSDSAAFACGEAPSDIGQVFPQEKAEGEFRVLLSHRPTGARENIERYGVDLQLSGHTHGGLMPGLDRLVAAANEGFVRGLYSIGAGKLYVSSGTGQWEGFPLRFFCPSEITLITLKKKTP